MRWCSASSPALRGTRHDKDARPAAKGATGERRVRSAIVSASNVLERDAGSTSPGGNVPQFDAALQRPHGGAGLAASASGRRAGGADAPGGQVGDDPAVDALDV